MLGFGPRQLRHFISIAESGTYTKSAKDLSIAQPALTASINRLEESLGVTLSTRNNKGVRLTPAGEVFLSEARRTIRAAEQARQSARLAELGEWGKVRLGFVESAVYDLLPRTLLPFIRSFPKVELDLREGETVNIMQMVRDSRLDVGIIRTPIPDSSDLRVIDLEVYDLIAGLPATHELARKEKIWLSDIRSEEFIMFSASMVPGLHAAVSQACRKSGFVPKIAQEATQALTVVGLVGSGLGVAIVPAVISNVSSARASFVKLQNAECQQSLTLSLIKRSDERSAATLKLCDIIRREATEL